MYGNLAIQESISYVAGRSAATHKCVLPGEFFFSCSVRESCSTMAHDVTLIPGDGVGPELAEATKFCLDATGVKFNWDVQEAGVDIMEKAGTPVPDSVIESIRRTGVALKAPITTPVGTGFRSVNVYLRQALDLYACVRPCKQYEGVRTFFSGTKVDIVIVRENTEDLYAGIEFQEGKPETAELIGHIKRLNGKVDPPRLGHLDQADLDHRLRPHRRATPSSTPASTAARRSRRSTRRTS